MTSLAGKFLLSTLLQTSSRHCRICCHSNFAALSTLQNNLLTFKSSVLQHDPVTVKRHYTIGDYDKLWQAVSSGRGKGRSGKKKTRPKEIDGEFLKFGQANISFPGLNEPIHLKEKPLRGKFDKLKNGATEPRHKQTRFRIDPAQRGWAGTTWPGRHAGAPVMQNGDIAEDFDSIVIEVKKVSVTRASGKRKRTSALVVVGNKKGSIGWAIGKASFASAAIRKARNKAVNYLHYVPVCEGATIFHNLETKVKSTKVIFERKVPGYGRRCQRIVRAIAELAGIDNIRCKIVGRTTPLSVVRAAFEGLQMQETHEELAERIGKHVVEYRPENGNRPTIVASPSDKAVRRRILEEQHNKGEEDLKQYFDVYRGAHRPKTRKEIQGTQPDIIDL